VLGTFGKPFDEEGCMGFVMFGLAIEKILNFEAFMD